MIQDKISGSFDFEPPALRQVSLRVAEAGGINLGQGNCHIPQPEGLVDAAHAAMREGENLYSPAHGIDRLREALVGKLRRFNRIPCGFDNVLVTHGSTGAFECVCDAFLEPGDEALLFRPVYPYHAKMIAQHGARAVCVDLTGKDWELDPAALEAKLTDRTKFAVICTPANPCGKVFRREELETIGRVCRSRGVFCVTDEVYEYLTYDERSHVSLASLDGMFDWTITMGSYSKTFAITGWRIGYVSAPESVVSHLASAQDQKYVCAPTPLQHGVAWAVENLEDGYYDGLKTDFARKRQILCDGLERAGFSVRRPQGAYYAIAGTSEKFPGQTSEEVVDLMIGRCGVGGVPAGDFLGKEAQGDPTRSNFLRFNFAMPDGTLEDACERLERL